MRKPSIPSRRMPPTRSCRAGSVLPAHDHRGNEQTFVIEGSCEIGAVGLAKGDFHRVEAGEHHGTVISKQGCTLLLVVDEADYHAA